MLLKILSVRTKEKGSPLVILTAEEEGKKIKYTITEGTYRKIGCPLSGEIVDEDSIAIITKEDEERRALAKALSLLGYTDNNERQLLRKLVLSGFSREAARYAIEECVRLGYIDEEKQLERLVLKYYGELLGPKKIMAKLISKLYTRGAISRAIQDLTERGEIDFRESKKALLRDKLPEGASYEEKYKLLSRYGY